MSYGLEACIRLERNQFHMEEYCEEYEVFYLVEEGSFRYRRGSFEETVHAGEGLWFEGGVIYQREVIMPLRLHLFRFHADERIFPETKVIFCDQRRIASTMEFLCRLDESFHKNKLAYCAALFDDLVNQLRMEQLLAQRLPDDPVIARAAAYLAEHLEEPPALPQLAESAQLSYVQFLRRFKKQTGMTPTEYLSALRMKKARVLLASTTLPLREIAAACGFECEFYLSNFFKKHSGMPPSAYRAGML